MPLRKGDGTGLINPHKGDGTGFTEIRKGDGTVLFSSGGGDDVTDGIHRYNFEDDGDTSTATDSWGDRDGYIGGATYTTDSQVGSYALDFDGTDDYVDLGSGGPCEGLSEVTLMCWATTRQSNVPSDIRLYGNDNNNVIQFIQSKDDRGTEDAVGARISRNGSWSGYANGSTPFPSDGTYFHVALTWSGTTGTLKVFYNGSEEDSTSTSTGSLNNPGDTAFIGINNAGGSPSGNEWDGLIDDFRIYDRVLSEQEVQDVYDATK